MKILIPRKIAIKLRYYVKFAEGEVSGMAKSTRNEEGDIVITDMHLFEQECSAATTDIDDKSMMEFLREAEARGENLKEWDVWWHSHGKIGVSWSSKDEETIADNGTNLTYMISLVTNKDEKFLGRLDVYPKDLSPFKTSFNPSKTTLDVEYIAGGEEDSPIVEEITKIEAELAEAEKYIKEKKEELAVTKGSLFEDNDVKELCEKEVKQKVREKYKETTYATNSRPAFYYNGKKKEDNDSGKENKQSIFEDILFDIGWAMPAHDLETYYEYDDTDVYGESDVFGDSNFLCPDCSQHKIYCVCEDALEKHRKYFEDSYYEDEDDDLALGKYIKNNYNSNTLFGGVSHGSHNRIHEQGLPFFKKG